MLVPWIPVAWIILYSKEWGSLNFKHRLAISLHLPQCMFVCTFVSEMRERLPANTGTTVRYIGCIIFPHTVWKLYLSNCKVGEPQFISHIRAACKTAKAVEKKASWKVHTCPFQTCLKYYILFQMFLALHPCFSSMVGRPFFSLKFKEKSKLMCCPNGL